MVQTRSATARSRLHGDVKFVQLEAKKRCRKRPKNITITKHGSYWLFEYMPSKANFERATLDENMNSPFDKCKLNVNKGCCLVYESDDWDEIEELRQYTIEF